MAQSKFCITYSKALLIEFNFNFSRDIFNVIFPTQCFINNDSKDFVNGTLLERVLSILIPGILPRWISFCAVPIIMYLVLIILRLSLFALSHSQIRIKSATNFLCSSEGLDSLDDSAVSSAYIAIFELRVTLGRSFTYMMKSRRPRIEPRGTPPVTLLNDDIFPLTLQHYVLSVRQDLKNWSSSTGIP